VRGQGQRQGLAGAYAEIPEDEEAKVVVFK